jgi:hypothetical protein
MSHRGRWYGCDESTRHDVKTSCVMRQSWCVVVLLGTLCGCRDSPTEVVVEPPPLRVVTGVPTSVALTGATLNATVFPGGQPTNYFFEFGNSTTYGTRTAIRYAGVGTESVKVSETVSGLTPGTVYHFRATVVIPTPDTIRGEDRAFSTIVAAPGLTLTDVRSVSATTVGLDGTVNPMGLPTTYHFEYGPTTAYGQSTAQQDAGSGIAPVSVGATIGNLATSGLYHWKLVAANGGGTAATSDSTFTTPVDLAFPVAVGTTWMYYYTFTDLGRFVRTIGTHTWTIESSTRSSDSISCTIVDVQYDTVALNWTGQYPDSAITTSSKFMIVAYADQILVNAPEFLLAHWLPRWVQGTIDTVTLSYDANASNPNVLKYVKGEGILSYTQHNGGLNGQYRSLTLVSSVKP